MPFNDQILMGSLLLAAGTYNEEEILLPPKKGKNLPAILEVEIEETLGAATTLNAADDYLAMHLSPKEQDDILDIADPDCICKILIESAGVSVSSVSKIHKYTFPAPLLVSYNKIWIGLKSTFAQTIKYRIHFVPRASNVPQKENLINETQF